MKSERTAFIGKIINILAFIWIASVMGSLCYAQEWAITYGGSDLERAYSVEQTEDGGYIIAGITESFGQGSYDLWILKLSPDGTINWQKCYGGTGTEGAFAIQQTKDGEYIVAGGTKSFGAGYGDIWVLKLHSDGTIDWQKCYGGTDNEGAYSIQQTEDGGYIIVGVKIFAGHLWILKLNCNGTVVWQKTFYGIYWDIPFSIQQTEDGGYIVGGNTESFGAGDQDFWILKLSPNGTIAWQKTYGGSSKDYATSIQQTSDGRYIVAGVTESFGAGGDDIWVLKLHSDSTIDWQKCYGGTDNEGAFAIQQTKDGEYIVAGVTESFGGGSEDLWILKLYSDGTVNWQKTYGGEHGDGALSIDQTEDGGYIVGGVTESFGAGNLDAFVLKLNTNGEISGCSAMGTSQAQVSNTSVIGRDTSVAPQTSSAVPANTYVSPQDTQAKTSVVCESGPSIVADKQLSVPYFNQGLTKWCFLNSLAMCLKFYSVPIHPLDIAAELNLGNQEGYGCSKLTPLLDLFSETDIRNYLGQYDLSPNFINHYAFIDYKTHINNEEPIIIGGFSDLLDGMGHAVVVTGYNDNDPANPILYIHDPSASFVHGLWGIVPKQDAYMYIAVPFEHVSNLAFGTVAFSVSPKEGSVIPYDCEPILYTGTMPFFQGGEASYYLNNQPTWDRLEMGTEMMKNTPSPLQFSYFISNQRMEIENFHTLLAISRNGNLVYSKDTGNLEVAGGAVREVHFEIPHDEFRNWDDGAYDFNFVLHDGSGHTYDALGPFTFRLASFSVKCSRSAGGSGSIELYQEANVCPADAIRGIDFWRMKIYTNAYGYVEVADDSWQWHFYVNPYMEDDNARDYRDTGQTPLEFKLEVYDNSGNSLWSDDAWHSTDSDGDGIYGDESFRGGSCTHIEGPTASLNSMPEKIIFKTRWRIYQEQLYPIPDVWAETDWLSSGEIMCEKDEHGVLDIADAIVALQILCGLNPGEVNKDADVNGDGRIGLQEVIYILQNVSGLR